MQRCAQRVALIDDRLVLLFDAAKLQLKCFLRLGLDLIQLTGVDEFREVGVA